MLHLTTDARPSTLLARGTKQQDGRYRLAFAGPATGVGGDALAHLPGRAAAGDPGAFAPPVGVRVGHRLLSSRPKVIDDFSGSSLMSILRMLQKVKNLDGPDDIAGAIPAAFAKANQPYIEIGLLFVLFWLVIVSAVGAVRSAWKSYGEDYPTAVGRTLAQQALMIQALLQEGVTLAGARSAANTEPELDLLVALHHEAVRHFQAGQGVPAGVHRRLGRNLSARCHGVRGNGDLSRAFNAEAVEIVARRMARNRIVASVEVAYQAHLLEKLEAERHAAKQARTAAFLTGFGMSGMAQGMVDSAAAAAATAVEGAAEAAGHIGTQAGAQAVAAAMDGVTGGVMAGAQVLQGTSGVLNGRLHRREHRQLAHDRAAVAAMGDRLAGDTHRVLAQDLDFRQRDSARSQVFDAMLAVGQAGMLGSGICNFAFPPAALGFGVVGATLTVAASVGASVNDGHCEKYRGAQAVDAVQQSLAVGNLGVRLRTRGLERVLDATAEGLAAHQAGVVDTRLWSDISAVMRREDITGTTPPRDAETLHARTVDRNRARGGKAHLLPAGVVEMHAVRERRYCPDYFDRPALQVQLALAEELWDHPSRADIVGLPKFQLEVFFATARDLAGHSDPQARQLFFDARGRRLGRIVADEAFFLFLERNPVAAACYLQRHNQVLARYLTPADRFGRDEHKTALTDLAHTVQKRAAWAGSRGLDAEARLSRL